MTKCPPNKVCKDTTTCASQYKDKMCKCVITPMDCDTFKTICAYEEGGFLYPCSVGCCKNQCDKGQCPEESKASIQVGGLTLTRADKVDRYMLAIAVLLIALVVISTISM
jgi:hypothetical protein